MIRATFLLFFLLSSFVFWCQTEEEKKLLDLVQSSDASVVFNAYRDLGYLFENSDTSKAMSYYKKGMEVAKNNNNKTWIASAFIDYGNVQYNSHQPELARSFFIEATHFAKLDNNRSRVGACYNNIANTFLQEFRNDSALHYSILALKEFTAVNDSSMMLVVKSNIASYLEDMRQLEDCLKYVDESVALGLKLKDFDSVVSALLTGAIAKTKLKDFNGAEKYLDRASELMPYTVNETIRPQFFQNLGGGYQGIEKYDKALQYADSALRLVKKFDFVYYKSSILMLKGVVLNDLNRPNEALPYINEALTLALNTRDWMVVRECYITLSRISEKQGMSDVALEYYKLYHQFSDSTLNEKISSQLVEVNGKYQLERKQFELERVQRENELNHLKEEKQRIILLTISGIAILIIIVLLLLYAVQRRKVVLEKQEIALQEAKISALEQEKQVVALDSIIKGEENERSRVAKDLHDGLGSLLSGVKLSLSTMRGNLIIEESQVRIFERSIQQLDEAIQEMRRVAHNMMPESLIKFGLVEAVASLCESIQNSGRLKIHYTSQSWNRRISSDKEIMAYRIVQELLNNAIKHSQATSVIVQLSIHNEIAQIEVEDNGAGFDLEKWNKGEGMGFSNLKNRVDYLKGDIHVQSDVSSGSSFVIEFPILS